MLFGDFGQGALEDIRHISNEIMVPLIQNAAQQGDWSDVLSKQVTDNAHKVAANGEFHIKSSSNSSLMKYLVIYTTGFQLSHFTWQKFVCHHSS